MCFSLSQIYILFRYIEYFFFFLTLYFSDEFLNILKQNVLAKEQKVLGLSKKSAAYLWEMFMCFFLYFFFRMPERKSTRKQRAPSAFLRLRRMPSSLKDRNSLCSNSLSFLTGVSLSLFYASKMRTGCVAYLSVMQTGLYLIIIYTLFIYGGRNERDYVVSAENL